jgi:hypothetical protein
VVDGATVMLFFFFGSVVFGRTVLETPGFKIPKGLLGRGTCGCNVGKSSQDTYRNIYRVSAAGFDDLTEYRG